MRKKHTPEEKMLILKQHLSDGKSVADLSKEHEIHPNQLYKWKKELFEGGAEIFSGRHKKRRRSSGKVEKLEEELRRKDGVISFLTEENMHLKKKHFGVH